MLKIRPLQNADESEWMRLRFALWPDYTPVDTVERQSNGDIFFRKDLD